MFPDWLPIDAFPELKTYRDFEKLTEGGFAEIYSAKRGEGEIPVIVKRLRPLSTKDPEHRGLFENEARILQKMNHPQIPLYFDGFISERECFIIMSQVEGRDPSQLMKNAKSMGKTFPIELAFFSAIQLGEILDFLHHFREPSGEPNPILHCDIKPHNILIGPELKVFLIDFSVACFLKNLRPHLRGTPAFMPPERLGAQEFTLQTDIFPITLSLFFLLTGQVLIQAKKMTQLFGKWLSEEYYSTIRAQHFPIVLEEFFLKNLSLPPGTRAQSATELSKQLVACGKQMGLDLSAAKLAAQYQDLAKIR